MYNRCESLSLCLWGGWSSPDYYPVVCEQEGSENPAPWLDDVLGATSLNCFDRCAVKVAIKNLSLLKYTTGSQRVKYRYSAQNVLYVLWLQHGSVSVCVWRWLLLCVSPKFHPTLLGECLEMHEWANVCQYIFYLVAICTGINADARLFHQFTSVGNARQPLWTLFFFFFRSCSKSKRYFHRTVGSITFSTMLS